VPRRSPFPLAPTQTQFRTPYPTQNLSYILLQFPFSSNIKWESSLINHNYINYVVFSKHRAGAPAATDWAKQEKFEPLIQVLQVSAVVASLAPNDRLIQTNVLKDALYFRWVLILYRAINAGVRAFNRQQTNTAIWEGFLARLAVSDQQLLVQAHYAVNLAVLLL